jgi:sensor histidine kinase regulating citrate/malate metabolism
MNATNPPIALTEEQAAILGAARKPVPVVNSQGAVIGVLSPIGFTEAEVAEAARRGQETAGLATTAEVLHRLNAGGSA